MQLTLDMTAAEEARDLGLDLVEEAHAGFVSFMRKVAKAICRTKGWVTSDDLRVLADKWGLKPDHPNAWGAVLRVPMFRVIGRKPSAVESSHLREIKVWAYVEMSH